MMWYPVSSLLIPYKMLYIQTSKLHMQRQTLDFRTLFSLSTNLTLKSILLLWTQKSEL